VLPIKFELFRYFVPLSVNGTKEQTAGVVPVQ
jgi:hypothetical protein